MKRLAFGLASAFLLAGPAASAQAPEIYTLVSELRQQSRVDALTIKEVYAPMVETAVFDDRDHLRRALESGELVEIDDLELTHLQPRLIGESPIAEKDLEHQHLYLAVRPAAAGMLLDIARRVEQGPLELTSLVRSTDYQRALMRGNGNANTDVPTHTMGYAVDIGLKFIAPDAAKALRAALDEMRDAGDIYYIAEANQLTFHIVPAPSRIPYFEQIYADASAPAPAEVAPPAPPEQAAPEPEESSALAGFWSWVTSLFR